VVAAHRLPGSAEGSALKGRARIAPDYAAIDSGGLWELVGQSPRWVRIFSVMRDVVDSVDFWPLRPRHRLRDPRRGDPELARRVGQGVPAATLLSALPAGVSYPSSSTQSIMCWRAPGASRRRPRGMTRGNYHTLPYLAASPTTAIADAGHRSFLARRQHAVVLVRLVAVAHVEALFLPADDGHVRVPHHRRIVHRQIKPPDR
jgi:hypothetical protein